MRRGDARDQVTKDVEEAGDVYFFANDQIPTLADSGALANWAAIPSSG